MLSQVWMSSSSRCMVDQKLPKRTNEGPVSWGAAVLTRKSRCSRHVLTRRQHDATIAKSDISESGTGRVCRIVG